MFYYYVYRSPMKYIIYFTKLHSFTYHLHIFIDEFTGKRLLNSVIFRHAKSLKTNGLLILPRRRRLFGRTSRTNRLAVPVNPRAAPYAGIGATRRCFDERGRDKGRFRTQAERRHVHLSTDVKVFPCGRSEQLPSIVVIVVAAAAVVVAEKPSGRSGARLIEDSSLFSPDSPAWSRGSANARNTRCSCSASIPGPCTRLVSRSPLCSFRFASRPSNDRRPVVLWAAGWVCSSFMWCTIMTRVTLVQRPGHPRRMPREIVTKGDANPSFSVSEDATRKTRETVDSTERWAGNMSLKALYSPD